MKNLSFTSNSKIVIKVIVKETNEIIFENIKKSLNYEVVLDKEFLSKISMGEKNEKYGAKNVHYIEKIG